MWFPSNDTWLKVLNVSVGTLLRFVGILPSWVGERARTWKNECTFRLRKVSFISKCITLSFWGNRRGHVVLNEVIHYLSIPIEPHQERIVVLHTRQNNKKKDKCWALPPTHLFWCINFIPIARFVAVPFHTQFKIECIMTQPSLYGLLKRSKPESHFDIGLHTPHRHEVQKRCIHVLTPIELPYFVWVKMDGMVCERKPWQ